MPPLGLEPWTFLIEQAHSTQNRVHVLDLPSLLIRYRLFSPFGLHFALTRGLRMFLGRAKRSVALHFADLISMLLKLRFAIPKRSFLPGELRGSHDSSGTNLFHWARTSGIKGPKVQKFSSSISHGTSDGGASSEPNRPSLPSSPFAKR